MAIAAVASAATATATGFRTTQVRGVLWGHVHQELDLTRKGIRYMATPATCSQFLPGSDDFALDTRPPGYRTLQLSSDGSIHTEVVWLRDRKSVV